MIYLLVFSPARFVIWALLLGVSLGVVLPGKRFFAIKTEEILARKGSLLPLSFAAWGINLAALYVSLLLWFIMLCTIPFFRCLLSEFRFEGEDYTLELVIATICLILIYGGLLFFSYFCFKKQIKNPSKRNRLFFLFVSASTFVFALLLCLGTFCPSLLYFILK